MVLKEVFQYMFIKASTFCMMVLFVRVFTNIWNFADLLSSLELTSLLSSSSSSLSSSSSSSSGLFGLGPPVAD